MHNFNIEIFNLFKQCHFGQTSKRFCRNTQIFQRMKTYLYLVALVAIFLAPTAKAFAKDDKVPVAVLSFIVANGVNKKGNAIAARLQELVTSEMASRQRFVVLDRTVFDKLLQEENLEVSEDFLNSSKLVETGKKTGAKFIVTGSIIQYTESMATQNGIAGAAPTTTYTITYGFALKIIKLETGETAFAGVISASKQSNNNYAEAVELCMIDAKCKISVGIMKAFMPNIRILSFEKVDKRGRPETVLIDAGEETFSTVTANGGKCNNVAGFNFWHGGLYLKVVELQVIDDNGKQIKREVPIGKLELKSLQGDAAICVVKEGDKEILEKFNAKANLVVTLY